MAIARFALAFLLTATVSQAQTLQELLPPGEYKFPASPGGAEEVKNLYTSGLVALVWQYTCSDGRLPETGFFDAALSDAAPYPPDAMVLTSSGMEGCDGGALAAIWADGKEMGDLTALAALHSCRAVTREEINRALKEHIRNRPLVAWDPRLSVEKLKARCAAVRQKMDTSSDIAVYTSSCRESAVAGLIDVVEEYRTALAQNPEKYANHAGRFVLYLESLEKHLAAPNYLHERYWWKR